MRRKKSVKHLLTPDTRYSSAVVSKFINYVMRKGKKTIAQKVVYRAFDVVAQKTGSDALAVFDTAMKNASPMLEVRPRRIGGATYQVPREVKGERRMALAFRWILRAARSRSGKPMAERLAEEIMAAAKNEGAAVKKRIDTHRMAEANKAFAHFAW